MSEYSDSALLRGIAERIGKANVAHAAALLVKRAEALQEAHRLAYAFAEAEPELRRVRLFGSLLPGRNYRDDSDIDMAVEGGNIFSFIKIAEVSPCSVDVVDLAGLREGMADRVRNEGVVLYEKDCRRF